MKEQDIRPAEIFSRYLQLTAADARTYFGDPTGRIAVPCPGCEAPDQPPSFVKEGFQYCHCSHCGSLFVSPRPSPSLLDAFYAESPSATYWAEVFFPASIAARREKIFTPRVERILELLDARQHHPGVVIDVGAGYGLFLDEYRRQRAGARLLAVEPGAKLAEVCRNQGFETSETTVEDAHAWSGKGDLVVCFEVLEHVFSPFEFVSSLTRLTAPGGYIVLSSLGADGFDVQVLWEHSNSVSPPHHLNFLGLNGYRRLFERAGLVDVEVLTPGRLDVDIVLNATRQHPELLGQQRFLRTLLARSQETRDRFQRFLADEALSSHTWIMAQKPHD